jgi:arginyl-tRNA synthetase
VEEDARTRDARLALADAVRITLSVGLSLLGIPTPENM